MRWALRYIKERSGGVKRPWLSFTTRERQGMGKRIEMGAPENPYRFGSGAAADEMQLMAGMPARSFGSGPGLLGVDIDRIARSWPTRTTRDTWRAGWSARRASPATSGRG
jgi:hypothetical protein